MPPSFVQELIDCVGAEWVLTQPGDLYLYSFDSALDRAMPSAVVLPETPEQVAAVVKILAKAKKPFVVRGAATSLCGGPVPTQNAVVIAIARLNKIGKVDKIKREVFVEPGVVNLRLQEAISKDNLFYPPDPGSQKACTIGGNVGTNAGGPHCLKYGVTSNYVMGLEVVLPDGQVVNIKTDDPGYDLTGFFVGSEGTLGIATRVKLKLQPKPAHIRTILVSFTSMENAIQAVTDIIAAGVLPSTLEAMDKMIIEAVEAFMNAGYPREAEAVLLIEVDGDDLAKIDSDVERIKLECEKNKSFQIRFAQDEAERIKLWEGRRGSYASMARLAPNVLVEDGAVPRTKLPQALKRIREIAEEYHLQVPLLFHAGDGNLHPQIIFDERDKAMTARVKEAGYKMLKACVELGGTISGEHGIGIDKREAMKWLFSRETLLLFRRLKNAFDPENLCNPDKLIPLISKQQVGAPSGEVLEIEKEVKESVVGSETPMEEKHLTELLQKFAIDKTMFGVQGMATKYNVRETRVIKMSNLNRVLDFDRGNLSLTIQAGVSVAEARATVEKEGQYLWIAGEGSIGGILATRASVLPPLRDLILGMRVALPTGEVVNLGAKTMKNVAGYDAAKLLLGSWGTLGIILDVTFRLFPYAATELSFVKPQPFVLRPLHKKIKAAFDPYGIMAPRTAGLTSDTISGLGKKGANKPEEKTPDFTEEEKVFKKLEDKFWL